MEVQNDYTTAHFAMILNELENHTPISDEYEIGHAQKGHWWESQKEHMVHWFKNQGTKGSGQFTRSKPNQSARAAYQRLQCPGALIWMAEALGEDEQQVREATDAAISAIASNKSRSASAAVRKVIPWERICKLVDNRKGTP